MRITELMPWGSDTECDTEARQATGRSRGLRSGWGGGAAQGWLSEPSSSNSKNVVKRRQCNNALAALRWHRAAHGGTRGRERERVGAPVLQNRQNNLLGSAAIPRGT